MTDILYRFTSLSPVVITLDIVLLAVLTVIIMFTVVFKIKLRKSIVREIEASNKTPSSINTGFSPAMLYLYSDYIEKLSRIYGLNIPVLCGLDEIWIRKLKSRPNRKLVRRVLQYSPDKTLFDVMTAMLRKNNLKKTFDEWIMKSGEFMVLRRIAVCGNGRPFDGKKAAALFRDEAGAIVEMSGDNLWQCRYFAATILLHIKEDNADKVLREAFSDPSGKIRRLVISSYDSPDREFIYKTIMDIFLNDPVFEVRKTAKERLDKDFTDLYSVKPEKLTIIQKLHLVELLNTESKTDENIGLSFLQSGNDELELYASRYLSKTGTLTRLFREADTGDMDSFNRTEALLGTAVRRGTTDFLDTVSGSEGAASLLIASRFLENSGRRSVITGLIGKAAELYEREPDVPEIRETYLNSLRCACLRGEDTALETVSSEMLKRRGEMEIQRFILPLLPERGESFFVPVMLTFLEDGGYTSRESLEEVLSNFPSSMIVPRLISIIRSGSAEYTVKKSALRILGGMGKKSGTQYILENLPLLSLDDAVKYTSYLKENMPAYFNERIKALLSSHDEEIKAAVTAALPPESTKLFLKEITELLIDSSPMVRKAAIMTLSATGNEKNLEACIPLLHDPVEEVRMCAAEALCGSGSEPILDKLKAMLFDDTETDTVKRAVINGFSKTITDEAFEVLAKKLKENNELSADAGRALLNFENRDHIRKLFELMADAAPDTRIIIKDILLEMGHKAEIIAEEILLEKESFLKPYAVEILDDSGIIETTARKLMNKDPKIRLKAAQFLSVAGSGKALRCLITAAKDPSEKVRIEVIKAIDRLNTDEGNALLEEMKNDPDKKVRKYTMWALERLEARKLEK